MKKGITYLFLVVYTTVMLKPLVPYVSDFVAHVCWQYEHISTVHYEHGKYHTHYESLAAAAKQDPLQKSSLAKNTDTVPEHISFDEPPLFWSTSIKTVHTPSSYLFAKQAYYPGSFRPPKA